MIEKTKKRRSQQKSEAEKKHYYQGTDAPWYEARDISEDERERFRKLAQKSSQEKKSALLKHASNKKIRVNSPNLDPNGLMPKIKRNSIQTLSLFSGCGGLDLGFDRAGFSHYASYEILTPGCETICLNRPDWRVFSGENGNVRNIDWRDLKGEIDIIHGGPPCQPFSIAGKQMANKDSRDLFPEFVRAVKEISPKAFVAENVASLAGSKFQEYLDQTVFKQLSPSYNITTFKLRAGDFGVPQSRIRYFIVGTCKKRVSSTFIIPKPTHFCEHLIPKNRSKQSQEDLILKNDKELKLCMGVRESLGLQDIDIDVLAPTIRSTLTGPRQTTSILSSSAAQKIWYDIEVWANGVQTSREMAHSYPAKHGHFRLSVHDCKILQGFPNDWKFQGPVYLQLGLIGNSVAPPMAYHIAKNLTEVL